MLPRTFLSAVFVVVAAPVAMPVAMAQSGGRVAAEVPEPPPAEAAVLGHGAMPGGQLVAAPRVLPAGLVGAAGFAAVGYRKELLGPEHSYARGTGSLAVAYSPLRLLTLGLTLDGRYDRHYGIAPTGEDGYVGDPRLLVRLARQVGPLQLGAQASVWLPGGKAPSVDFGATTVELRALAGVAAGPAQLVVNAGFRLDRSSRSVDDPRSLTPQDQISLGVGEFNAAVVGAMVSMPVGRLFFSLEGDADLFVGSDHPDATLRGLLSAGVRLSPRTSVIAFAQLAKVATPPADQLMADGTVPLIAYDPRLNFGLGLEGRFGGGGERSGGSGKPYVVTENPIDQPIAVAKVAAISGTVLDDAGAPVVGAKVTISTEKKTGTAITDARGKYRIGELAPGPAKIDIEVAGKKPQQLTVTLVEGANPAPQVQLDPVLLPGELRGNVRTRSGGRAIAGAKISVAPGDLTTTSGSDGTFALTVPPGKYTMTTVAEGFAPQTIEAVVDQEGVTVKFVNLDKK
jgi:hypothetical protein